MISRYIVDRLFPVRTMRQRLANSTSPPAMVYASIVIAAMLAPLCQCQTICSTERNYCRATFSSDSVVDVLSCGGFGIRTEFPAVCTDSKTITHLLIEPGNTTINSLQASAFNGLRIGELTLSGLGVRSVTRDLFNGLGPYLETLHMDQNQITDLPVGLFNSLSRLRYLDLQKNLVTGLRNGFLDPLTSLAYLNLANNVITQLESGSFTAPTRLVQLQLQGNRIDGLLDGTFNNLAALEDLNLAGNRIPDVTDTSFSGLTSLRNINLTRNHLASIPNGIFLPSASSLESIDLSHNLISLLASNSVSDLPRLKLLLLNDNLLTQVPPYQFSGLSVIETLRLSGNNISNIESNSFTGMPYLFTLDMSSNSVPRLPQGLFDPLGAVLYLDFGNNLIEIIEPNPFTAQIQMTYISLAGNRLSNVTKDWFQFTTKLKTLLLGDNRIKAIDLESFDSLVELENLDLGENLLTSDALSGVLRGCERVKALRLSGNPLGRVTDETFASMRDMMSLYLDHCCIQQISFKSPLGVKEVQLQRNFISTLQTNAFAGLVELARLDLSSNGLEMIEPGALYALKVVKYLNLRHNHLTSSDVTVPENVDPTQRDYHFLIPQSAAPGAIVDLSWNKITDLKDLQRYASVYLVGNPLQCSCLQPAWLVTNQNSFTDRDVTTCVDQSDSSLHQAACYWSNQITCPSAENNSSSSGTPPPGLCPGNVTRTLDYTAIIAEEARARVGDRSYCYGESTEAPGEGLPRIFLLDVSANQWTITAHWNVTAIVDLIEGYSITLTSKSLLPDYAKDANRQLQVGNETYDIRVDMQYGGRYSVCVSVALSNKEQDENVTNTANISPRCSDVTLYPTECDVNTVTWSQCVNQRPKRDITKWLIIGLVVGGSLLVLLIVLVIVCLVLRHRRMEEQRKAAEREKKAGVSAMDIASMSKVTGKEYYDTMAEQSTVSVQDFVLY